MSPGAWFFLGLMYGVGVGVAVKDHLDRRDAVAAQYVRPAGSDTVRRIR